MGLAPTSETGCTFPGGKSRRRPTVSMSRFPIGRPVKNHDRLRDVGPEVHDKKDSVPKHQTESKSKLVPVDPFRDSELLPAWHPEGLPSRPGHLENLTC